jgi:hypothetical protein
MAYAIRALLRRLVRSVLGPLVSLVGRLLIQEMDQYKPSLDTFF